MDIDWNPVVHILDELSEGTHSFLELSYSQRHYKGSAYLDALLFLADRQLIELSQGPDSLKAVSHEEWRQRLRDAFGVEAATDLARTFIDLTSDGGQLLRLLGVGHPPL